MEMSNIFSIEIVLMSLYYEHHLSIVRYALSIFSNDSNMPLSIPQSEAVNINQETMRFGKTLTFCYVLEQAHHTPSGMFDIDLLFKKLVLFFFSRLFDHAGWKNK